MLRILQIYAWIDTVALFRKDLINYISANNTVIFSKQNPNRSIHHSNKCQKKETKHVESAKIAFFLRNINVQGILYRISPVTGCFQKNKVTPFFILKNRDVRCDVLFRESLSIFSGRRLLWLVSKIYNRI